MAALWFVRLRLRARLVDRRVPLWSIGRGVALLRVQAPDSKYFVTPIEVC